MANIRKEISLDEGHVKEFEVLFPGTPLSFVLNLLLEKFVCQYKMTPEEYAEVAARELKEEIS